MSPRLAPYLLSLALVASSGCYVTHGLDGERGAPSRGGDADRADATTDDPGRGGDGGRSDGSSTPQDARAPVDPGEPCVPYGPNMLRDLGPNRHAVLARDGSDMGILWAVDPPHFGSCSFVRWRYGRVDTRGRVTTVPTDLMASGVVGTDASLHFVPGGAAALIVANGADGWGVYLYRFRRNGIPMGPPTLVVPGARQQRSVLTETGYAIAVTGPAGHDDFSVWTVDRDGGNARSTGLTLPGVTPHISTTAYGVVVAAAGNHGTAPFSHVQSVDRGGVRLGEPHRLCCAASDRVDYVGGSPAVIGAGAGALVFYADSSRLYRPLQVVRLDGAGVPVSDRPFTDEEGFTTSPAVARSALGDIAVVYERRTSFYGRDTIYFARFAETGEMLEAPRAIVPEHEPIGCEQGDELALVATETGFAVAWSEYRGGDRGQNVVMLSHVCRQ